MASVLQQFLATIFWLAATALTVDENHGQLPVCWMYLTGQHDVIPEYSDLLEPITHVALAFMPSRLFFDDFRHDWPLFRTVKSTRDAFLKGTKILVAIGGWGDTGFSVAAYNHTSREAFARNVARMVTATGADGVDIDWEYPGGNGEDYKRVPNSEKEWEIEAYPLLLGELRTALGQTKLITAAVPGLKYDMIAFTDITLPRIMRHVDYLNVMTYDLMNRRSTVTRHHSSISGTRRALRAYLSHGAFPEKLNVGIGFYVKWVRTDKEDCDKADSPIGCKTLPLEDPETGADMGNAGAFSWHDPVPEELKESFQEASVNTEYDHDEGATYYYDKERGLWWTYDEGRNGDITAKVRTIMKEMNLAGVFAWGLGEDGTSFRRLAYLQDALKDDVLDVDGNEGDDKGLFADLLHKLLEAFLPSYRKKKLQEESRHKESGTHPSSSKPEADGKEEL